MKGYEHLALLRAAGLRAKKAFGQNFLVDDGILAAIARECVPEAERGRARVVELGAGLGALTAPLTERASHVSAVERDRDLVPRLAFALDKSASRDAYTIVEGDAQQVDLEALFRGGEGPRVLCGNLPYQITGQLLRLAVEQAEYVDRVVFMVQEEVAERIAALPGSKVYGALSVFVQAAFVSRVAIHAPPGAFVPPPHVSSAVVVLLPHRPRLVAETETFRALVKGAFGARRKTLRNAWRSVGRDPLHVAQAAETAGISLDARGETLDVHAYGRMARALDDLSETAAASQGSST
jgi:16S rRNA (adenine1518-N6/adenine1519-N6)-dimethyltransferase